ncbi:MAG: ABC transporter permease subunit [Syntrophaceticus schinkii]|nr:ABC transporter permease subunit [Syntrophaceticus schinkii]MDD4262413.1 ABC transporter permease subunit [Syntrophaceticus schinkii]
MFSKTIFKQTFKANFKLWLIITLLLIVFCALLIGVFKPETISNLQDLIKGSPLESILEQQTFLGMLAQTYYSIHGVILPIIFIIITANSLIASQVDRGSMAYLLSTPIKRSAVVGTQAVYMVTSILVMFIIVTIVGLFSIHIFQGDIDINITDYLLLNLGLFLLMFAISSISFLFSCIFNLSKNSLALGAGIPIAFFLFQLMSQVDESLEGFKYLSLNSLFDTNAILNDGSYLTQFIALAVVGVVLYGIGMRIFMEKDLPL